MKRAARLIAVALLLGASSAVAKGPQVDSTRALLAHMAKGVPQTRVGDWITYRIYGASPHRTAFIRVGIAKGEKDRFGRDAQWIDVELGEHHKMKAPLMQVRLLVAPGASGDKPAITRGYFAHGTERVQELSPEALGWILTPEERDPQEVPTPKERAAFDPSKSRITTGKEQRLMTLAGTVTAVPVEVRYGSTVIKRIWVSRELPIMQLAKLEMPVVDHALEVREFGTGYVSEMILPAANQPKIGVEQITAGEDVELELPEGEDHAH